LKKLLTLTILLTTFIQADNATSPKQSICYGLPAHIAKNGLGQCKAGDILVDNRYLLSYHYRNLPNHSIEDFLTICVYGTIVYNENPTSPKSHCILRAEKDFAYIRNPSPLNN